MTLLDDLGTDEWSCDLGYITLRGRHVRPSASSTVIALHGFLDNANSIAHLANAFPDDHFIAMDLAGHGLSDHRPPGTHYNLMDYVQDLYVTFEKLNIDQAVLVGHSLGGIVCALFAASFPDKVKMVISIDALGPLTQDESTTVTQIAEAIISRSKKMQATTPKAADLEIAVATRAKSTDLSADLCRHILRRNIVSQGDKSVWSSDPRLRTQSYFRLTDAQAENVMSAICCPFLIIGATNSFKQIKDAYARRRQWIPQANLKLLAGGHHVHLEREEDTVQAIKAFVSNL